jgi:hypothetical protein
MDASVAKTTSRYSEQLALVAQHQAAVPAARVLAAVPSRPIAQIGISEAFQSKAALKASRGLL